MGFSNVLLFPNGWLCTVNIETLPNKTHGNASINAFTNIRSLGFVGGCLENSAKMHVSSGGNAGKRKR